MNRYSVWIHKGGSGMCATVDADNDRLAEAEAVARWHEVNPYTDPTGGLLDITYLGPAPVRAPFVAFARLDVAV